jgi:L-2-hydroxycarboxylate dehydrogenase (NAD+)
VPNVDLQHLSRFITDAFMAVGFPRDDAAIVAERMVEADIIGADAHGVFRLPQYIRRLRAGGVNANPQLRVERTGPSTARVDGDNGMGHLVMTRAADLAVEMARETGVAWVGTVRSNHAGAASVYVDIPVRAGMIGIYSAVASANHMPPWGGIESLLGTNPLAIGLPLAAGAPVMLDFATTVVSYGTVKGRELRGQSMPEGWMIDKMTGQPLTDPRRSNEGFLLPIGGYKGAGLSMVLGLLAGVLNGAAIGRDVVDFNADDVTPANTGQFILALDVSRFMEPETFAAAARKHLDELRGSERLTGVEHIRLPGDERARRRAERLDAGVPVPEQLLEKLDAISRDLGVALLESAR